MQFDSAMGKFRKFILLLRIIFYFSSVCILVQIYHQHIPSAMSILKRDDGEGRTGENVPPRSTKVEYSDSKSKYSSESDEEFDGLSKDLNTRSNEITTSQESSFETGSKHFKSGVLSHMLGYDGNSKSRVKDMASILADSEDAIVKKDELSLSFKSDDTSHYYNLLAETPPKYLPNYKTPCWKERLKQSAKLAENHSGKQQLGVGWKLRCLPYFYVAGVHKAGTTDLFARLQRHPLLTNFVKELHWWSWARNGIKTIRREFEFPPNSTIKQYVDVFDMASKRICDHTEHDTKTGQDYHPMILGEGCPSYLWYTRGWRKRPEQQNSSSPRYLIGDYIHHVTPHARIIFSFRNPTEREYSFYKFIHAGSSSRSVQHFKEIVATGIPIMQDCLQNHSPYYCATNPDIIAQINPLKLHMGMYVVFLKRWMEIFSWDQIYILRTEDYDKQRSSYVNDILKFLGVGSLTEAEVEGNENGKKINHNENRTLTWGPIPHDTRKLLDDFYRPFNLQLAQLLKDDRFAWLD